MNRSLLRLRPTAIHLTKPAVAGLTISRPLPSTFAPALQPITHTATFADKPPTKNLGGSAIDDALAESDARGRTGGGETLSSSQNAPKKPKIDSAALPQGEDKKLTKEQQAEVDRHNEEFEATREAATAKPENDKVDKEFWSNEGKSVKK
ncbi:hypothetical protein ACHAQA_006084 [Verticillium albo-atrum]